MENILFDANFLYDQIGLQRGIGRIALAYYHELSKTCTVHVLIGYKPNAEQLIHKHLGEVAFVVYMPLQDMTLALEDDLYSRLSAYAQEHSIKYLFDPAPMTLAAFKPIRYPFPVHLVFYDAIPSLYNFPVQDKHYRRGIARYLYAEYIYALSLHAWKDYENFLCSKHPHSVVNARVLCKRPNIFQFYDPVPIGERHNSVLCITSPAPHKYYTRAIDIWRALPETIQRTHTLKLLGMFTDARILVELEYQLFREGLRVEFYQSIDESTLRTWYRHSKAVLHVSDYEGLGLPPLEAIAYGTPALTYRGGGGLIDIADVVYTYRTENEAADILTRWLEVVPITVIKEQQQLLKDWIHETHCMGEPAATNA
ncbi:MAG: glycosyltransferase [Chloroflexi bacterium]|nr:MAG: glycosyltransferase [Chloroflexota bacterium]